MARETILTEPTFAASIPLEQAIRKRRTARAYSGAPISLGELSQLLWAAQGVTGQSGQRTTPSAGTQYPLQVCVVAGAVTDLPVGLYEHSVDRHSLMLVSDEDLRAALGDATIDDQPWVREAAVILVVVANMRRIERHFQAQPPRGERGARYAYIETGALAENVHLQATGMGLSVVLVGGFDDDKLNAALQSPDGFAPTALLCVGNAET